MKRHPQLREQLELGGVFWKRRHAMLPPAMVGLMLHPASRCSRFWPCPGCSTRCRIAARTRWAGCAPPASCGRAGRGRCLRDVGDGEGERPLPDDRAVSDALRVALLNPCFFPEVRRGSERIVRELADDLLERGHLPRLITSHPGRPSRSVEQGLPVIRHWRPFEEALLRRLAAVPDAPSVSYASLLSGPTSWRTPSSPRRRGGARWAERTGRPYVFSSWAAGPAGARRQAGQAAAARAGVKGSTRWWC